MLKILTTLVSVAAAGVFLWGTVHQIQTQQTLNGTFNQILDQVDHANKLTDQTLTIASPIADIAQGVDTMNQTLSSGVIPKLKDSNTSLQAITDHEAQIIAALNSLNSVTSTAVSQIHTVADANHRVLGLVKQANAGGAQELTVEQNLNSLTSEGIDQLTVLNKKFALLGQLP